MKTEAVPLTLLEYANLPEREDTVLTELVRGTVVREPRPGRAHGRVQVRLAAALEGWARSSGAIVTVESGYILSDEPATVRGPDVAVVVAPGRSEGEPGGWTRGAPDVAVEVLSPSDTATAVQQKILDYLKAGTKLVWVVDPALRTVAVYRPEGSALVLGEPDTLEGENVLEGFAVTLAEVFEGV